MANCVVLVFSGCVCELPVNVPVTVPVNVVPVEAIEIIGAVVVPLI